jgi:transcriptional regulator with XRE-family HTH domain
MPLLEVHQIEINMYNYCMNSNRLGEYLKAKRLENGLSRQALAGLLHVSLGHINNIERGDRLPSSTLMMAFEKQFGLKTGVLYSLLENENLVEESPIKPKSRIPDLPPDPPLEDDLMQYISDPKYGLYFSKPYLSKLSNRQLRQIALQIKLMVEEGEFDEE